MIAEDNRCLALLNLNGELSVQEAFENEDIIEQVSVWNDHGKIAVCFDRSLSILSVQNQCGITSENTYRLKNVALLNKLCCFLYISYTHLLLLLFCFLQSKLHLLVLFFCFSYLTVTVLFLATEMTVTFCFFATECCLATQ